jgi:AraC family transcriptional regulator, activator of mtrCDE
VTQSLDWLSRLLEILPVHGQLELRCFYGAPWEVAWDASPDGEMPYHVIVGGAATLENPAGGAPRRLTPGDIVVFPHGRAHRLHDGGGAKPAPERQRQLLNIVISENTGVGERLDMLCGRFALDPRHGRLMRDHLPDVLVVSAASHSASTAQRGAAAQLAGLVSLLREESAAESLGGRAMLNALSTALFALVLRLASETEAAPSGLLALAGHPRLAPALSALFNQPAHPWTLPELARLCNMSRATLARHFQDTLGRSASDLLTDIRMTLAAGALRDPARSAGEVADSVGYQSEAAFQRAFKAHMGLTPAQWRKTGQAAVANPGDTPLA